MHLSRKQLECKLLPSEQNFLYFYFVQCRVQVEERQHYLSKTFSLVLVIMWKRKLKWRQSDIHMMVYGLISCYSSAGPLEKSMGYVIAIHTNINYPLCFLIAIMVFVRGYKRTWCFRDRIAISNWFYWQLSSYGNCHYSRLTFTGSCHILTNVERRERPSVPAISIPGNLWATWTIVRLLFRALQ